MLKEFEGRGKTLEEAEALPEVKDVFRIEVLGTAAHAAEPHLGVDAIVIGSEIDCALVHESDKECHSIGV